MRSGAVTMFFCNAATFSLLMAGTAVGQQVSTDYNHKQDFAQYHTFSVRKVQSSDPFFQQRISDEITRDLQAKGLQQVQSGGDLAVTAIGRTKNEQEYNTFYDGLGGMGFGWGGWGGWYGRGWGGGLGETTTTAQNIPVGTLVVDLYDTGTHQLVWRGMSREDLSTKPDKNIGKVDKAVHKMFDKYPPKGGK